VSFLSKLIPPSGKINIKSKSLLPGFQKHHFILKGAFKLTIGLQSTFLNLSQIKFSTIFIQIMPRHVMNGLEDINKH